MNTLDAQLIDKNQFIEAKNNEEIKIQCDALETATVARYLKNLLTSFDKRGLLDTLLIIPFYIFESLFHAMSYMNDKISNCDLTQQILTEMIKCVKEKNEKSRVNLISPIEFIMILLSKQDDWFQHSIPTDEFVSIEFLTNLFHECIHESSFKCFLPNQLKYLNDIEYTEAIFKSSVERYQKKNILKTNETLD